MSRKSVLWLAYCAGLSAVVVASASSDEALLREVEAGAKANSAKILFGTAKYDVEVTRKSQPPSQWRRDVTVMFDGSKSRMDFANERVILANGQMISFDTTGLGTPEALEDFNYSAIITPQDRGKHWDAHPRDLGIGIGQTMGHVISRFRDKPDSGQISAERDGSNIRIETLSKAGTTRNKYWVSPAAGYNVIRHEIWSHRDPDRPIGVRTSEFQRADSGAYVLSKSEESRSIDVKGKLEPHGTLVITLREINLMKRPDAKVFTLAGLGLPQGARIQDRVRGKDYTNGELAVNEHNVKRFPALPADDTWRMPRIDFLLVGTLVGVLAAVAIGYYLLRMRG